MCATDVIVPHMCIEEEGRNMRFPISSTQCNAYVSRDNLTRVKKFLAQCSKIQKIPPMSEDGASFGRSMLDGQSALISDKTNRQTNKQTTFVKRVCQNYDFHNPGCIISRQHSAQIFCRKSHATFPLIVARCQMEHLLEYYIKQRK